MEFPKVETERDKAQAEVTKLTERVKTAEREAEQAKQAAKQAENKQGKMAKSLEAIKLVLQTQRNANAEHKRMSMEFPKVETERDKAQAEVTELTERVTTVEREAEQAKQTLEQQVVEMTKRARDAEKKVVSATKSKEQVNKLCATLSCGQATYRELQTVVLARDTALVQVTQLEERLAIKSREVKNAQKDMQKVREAAQNAKDAEEKLRDLEKRLFLNAKQHKWVLVASALGMDGDQFKRIQYLAKRMHDTRSEDWKDSVRLNLEVNMTSMKRECQFLRLTQ